MERNGALECCRERMQLAAQTGFERLKLRQHRGARRNRGRIFRVEIAAPVDVVAQELRHQLLEQGIVLAIGAEEAGIERGFHVSSAETPGMRSCRRSRSCWT